MTTPNPKNLKDLLKRATESQQALRKKIIGARRQELEGEAEESDRTLGQLES